MLSPNLKPTSYQDLKFNLVLISCVMMTGLAVLLYLTVVPDAHRAMIEKIGKRINENPLVGGGLLAGIDLVACGFISYMLFGVFELHQRYDSFFVKWRQYYDTDYILPRLIRPFAEKTDPRFLDTAVCHRKDFMDLYYQFIGDHGRSKLPDNLKIRFYSVALKFWITQVAEILMICTLGLMTAYSIYYYRHHQLEDVIVFPIILMSWAFILNRLLASQALNELKRNTQDQIQAIHEQHSSELERRLKELHERFGLKYRGRVKNPNDAKAT